MPEASTMTPEPVAVADPPAAPAESPTPAVEQVAAPPEDVASLPEWAQKLIRKKGQNEQAGRAKAASASEALEATRDAIAKALGLKDDDDPVAAAKTAADERDAAKAVNKNLAVENAVLRMAVKHGANPESLTDSRSFMRQLEAIDPAADDFATQVETAIKAAVEANPSLKAGIPAPARSGGTVGGSAPAQQSSDPQQRSRDYYAAQATK